MASIGTYLDSIKSAIYGEDVRDSIYNAISAINDENAILSSEINNSVDNTLNNLRVYKYVDQLPEKGDSKYIYAVANVDYVDSDSNESTYEQWSTLNTNPTYIQVPINRTVYNNVSANALKPVMARYYLTNSMGYITKTDGSSRSVEIGVLTLINNPLTITTRNDHTDTFDTVSLECCDVSNLGSGRNRYGRVDLEFAEFIYDANDRKWKFNKEINISYEQMAIINVENDTAQFVPRLDYHNPSLLLSPILIAHNVKGWEYISEGIKTVYYNGYSFTDAFGQSTITVSPKLGQSEYDTYGYLTESNSTQYVISYYGDFYWDGSPAPDTPIIEYYKKWDVPYASNGIATMYIWSDAFTSYINLVADLSNFLPTGYSVTLDSESWDEESSKYVYTVEDIPIDENQAYMVSISPDRDSKEDYYDNNVYCKEVTTSGLVFEADSVTVDLDIGIIVQKINGTTIIDNR